ncbi:hypothetical protein Tco_0727893 [Tanacetum coccineum]|uniref:Uncharacterized protein n=1 Tax=Tanacetum coccineum TaxID=301880 RepID=A0ABQ4YM73_9ASTR
MDRYTKNALWVYWTRGDDEVELNDEEISDPYNENLIDKDEVDEILKIETDVFDFETPICKAFDEFNYLLNIDTDLLTSDILGFKTCDEFKNECYMTYFQDYEWYDDLVDGKLEDEALKQTTIYERTWGDATQGVINFYAWLKGCFRNFHELDYELFVKLEQYWWKMNNHECSPFSN